MTVSGKIQKHTLRDLAAETLGLADVKVFASPAERPDPDATDDECAVRGTGGS